MLGQQREQHSHELQRLTAEHAAALERAQAEAAAVAEAARAAREDELAALQRNAAELFRARDEVEADLWNVSFPRAARGPVSRRVWRRARRPLYKYTQICTRNPL